MFYSENKYCFKHQVHVDGDLNGVHMNTQSRFIALKQTLLITLKLFDSNYMSSIVELAGIFFVTPKLHSVLSTYSHSFKQRCNNMIGIES